MENDPLKIAYDAAIDAGYKHVSIAKSSGVSEDSLRQFYKNGSLGRERRAALEVWLDANGFTGREKLSDVLAEVRSKLAGCIDVLDNPVHPRSRKARVVLNQIKVLVGEYGTELEKIGLQLD